MDQISVFLTEKWFSKAARSFRGVGVLQHIVFRGFIQKELYGSLILLFTTLCNSAAIRKNDKHRAKAVPSENKPC